jgi:endonuclease/exonuclease/phosphatase family metal-dependent hydrolase
MPSLKLISLNIERSKHLDRIIPFLREQKADVVCLQELLERDIPRLEEIIGPCRVYGIGGYHPADAPEIGDLVGGHGIFTALPIGATGVAYYAGSLERARSRQSNAVLDDIAVTSCDIEKDEAVFRVATTHFTWTPDGSASDKQRRDMKELLRVLGGMGQFVLTGDFNAPRFRNGQPGEIFGKLAETYKDNIPPEYTTSIDGTLHRAGQLPYMVDGLFSTSGYTVSDVTLVDGLSDHMAVVATISKS